jgi:hypothetical protein
METYLEMMLELEGLSTSVKIAFKFSQFWTIRMIR